jgi:hypothetical protein
MRLAPVRAAPASVAQVPVADGGFRTEVAFAMARRGQYQGSGRRETHAGRLESGGELIVQTRRAGPPSTPEEIRTLKRIVERKRQKIQFACKAIEGPWDERTRRMAAECFLLPPSGPSPVQAATIKSALSRMRDNVRGDVTIKLMEPGEVEELNANGAVLSPPLRILAEKNHLTVRDMWTDALTFPGTVRIDRELLTKKGESDWVALHEETHRAGTVDTDDLPGQPAEAGAIDVEEYLKSGKIRYYDLPTNRRMLLANADSYAAFITKLYDTRVPASLPRRNLVSPRHKHPV